jgi:hypothetical protein
VSRDFHSVCRLTRGYASSARLAIFFGFGESWRAPESALRNLGPRSVKPVASDVVARFARGCRTLNYQALADMLSLSRALGTFVILPSRIR